MRTTSDVVKTLIIVIVIPLLVSFLVNYWTTSGFSVLRYENPQKILVSGQPSTVARAALHRGDKFSTIAVKCNTTSSIIPVEGHSFWVRDEPSTKIISLTIGDAIRFPGCQTATHEHIIPNDLDFGTWHIEGVETAIINGQTLQVAWYTDKFDVIP